MDNENSQLWKSVEQDKLKYKIFMFISLAAWTIAIGVLVYIGYLFYLDYQHIIGQYNVGQIHTHIQIDIQTHNHIYLYITNAHIYIYMIPYIL